MIALSEVLALFEKHERNRRWFEGSYQRLVEKYERARYVVEIITVHPVGREQVEARVKSKRWVRVG